MSSSTVLPFRAHPAHSVYLTLAPPHIICLALLHIEHLLKGIWLAPWSAGEDAAAEDAAAAAPADDALPFCTVIGSPNLGRRSVERDFESALVVLTTHAPLQRQLDEERRRLFDAHTEAVDDAVFARPDRTIGPKITGWANGNWIRVAMPILRPFF